MTVIGLDQSKSDASGDVVRENEFIYVSQVFGNDNGNGSPNQPFKTLAKALEYASSLTVWVYNPVIQVIPPYDSMEDLECNFGEGAQQYGLGLAIYGNRADPSSVKINTFYNFGNSVSLQGFTAVDSIGAQGGFLQAMDCATVLFQASPFGEIIIAYTCKLTGNRFAAFHCDSGRISFMTSSVVTFVGNPNYSVAALHPINNGAINIFSPTTFSGSIVGRPMYVATGGVITTGGNASFPAGTLPKGGSGGVIDGVSYGDRVIATPYTVSQLGSAVTAGIGARAFVTDSNTVVYNATVAGGGANKVPVFSDGTNWKVG